MNPQGVPSKYAYHALGRRVGKTDGVHTVHDVSSGAQEIVAIRGSLSRYHCGEDVVTGAVEILGEASPSSAEQSWQDTVLISLLPSAQRKINFPSANFATPAGWNYHEGAAFAARAEQTLPGETSETYGRQAAGGTSPAVQDCDTRQPCIRPSGIKMVGFYHSHTASSGFGPPSLRDQKRSHDLNIPIYTGRRHGKVDKANHSETVETIQ